MKQSTTIVTEETLNRLFGTKKLKVDWKFTILQRIRQLFAYYKYRYFK